MRTILKQGLTTIEERHSALRRQIWPAFVTDCEAKLRQGVLFHQDNAPSHDHIQHSTSIATLYKCSVKILSHPPIHPSVLPRIAAFPEFENKQTNKQTNKAKLWLGRGLIDCDNDFTDADNVYIEVLPRVHTKWLRGSRESVFLGDRDVRARARVYMFAVSLSLSLSEFARARVCV